MRPLDTCQPKHTITDEKPQQIEGANVNRFVEHAYGMRYGRTTTAGIIANQPSIANGIHESIFKFIHK